MAEVGVDRKHAGPVQRKAAFHVMGSATGMLDATERRLREVREAIVRMRGVLDRVWRAWQ